MIPKIGYSEALHRLRHILLGAARGTLGAVRAKGVANRRHNTWQERRVDCVGGNGAVNRSGIRGRGIVHRVVIWIQTEGKIIRNLEDSVAATNNGLRIYLVGKTDARRHFRR